MSKAANIFIPTSNRLNSLKKCLDSLDRQSLKDFTILLAGMKDDEKIQKLVLSYKKLDIEYFIQSKSGLIGAANEALDRATCEIFVRIDDDTTMHPEWFRSMVEAFKRDIAVGGVTGPTIMNQAGLHSRDLTAVLENFKNSENWVLKLVYKIYNNYLYENKMYEVSTFLKSGVFTLGSNYKECLKIEKPLEVSNLEACNWSARTSLLKQIGGFDTIYIKGLGDYHEADAALKIQRLSYKLIFDPKVSLEHHVESGKVKKARPAPYHRIQNLLIFYFRFFRIANIDQLFRFLVNLTLQNTYYFLNFFRTGSVDQLGALFGTVVGLYRVIIKEDYRYSVAKQRVIFCSDANLETKVKFPSLKVKMVDTEELFKVYDHPSAVLFRALELKMMYESVKEYEFLGPSLDVGCGDGLISSMCFAGKFTYGVDNGEAKDVEEAIKNCRYEKIFLEGAEQMSLKDESVNFVFSNSVIEHIPDNDATLSEIYRVLKPGGYFLFTSPSAYFSEYLYVSQLLAQVKMNFLIPLYVKYRNKMLNHYHLYDHKSYAKKLEARGFKLVSYSYTITKEALNLWDKMGVLSFARRFFDHNANSKITSHYKQEINGLVSKGKNSKVRGADLLILCTK